MKKFAVIVAILTAVAAGVFVYLKATTPAASPGVRVPLTAEQHDLLASVPAFADTFALIPRAAVVRQKLLANPVTRRPLLDFSVHHQLPSAWMIGGADLVVWRSGKETSYAMRLDPFRATLVRFYLMFASGVDASVHSGTFLINAGASEPLGPQRLDALLAVANGFGPADALFVQQPTARGDFPPIGRPSVTAVQIGADDVVLTSVAAWSDARPRASTAEDGRLSTRPRFPRGALISAVFQSRPRIVGDLDRLTGAKVSHLLDNGGSVVLYDVNAGTLLPRPDGLVIAPATPDNVKTASQIESTVKIFGDVQHSGDRILMSFDRDSMQKYASDTFVDAQWPSSDWAVRLDPQRAIPIADKLGGNVGLRFAAGRVYRAARNLDDWMQYLANAGSVEVSHFSTPAREELRVRIASK